MKKILTSLLTSLFVGSTATSVISCNTDNKNEDKSPIKKQEITESNLNEFFKVHNTFEYKGEFFFKEKESKEEIVRVKGIIVDDSFKYILNETFGSLFKQNFNYIPSEYTIRLWDPSHYEGAQFSQNYSFNFKVKIDSNKNNIHYETEPLTLNFMQTKQYDDQNWLEKYLSYLTEANNWIWEKKYKSYQGSFYMFHMLNIEMKHKKTDF